MSLSSALPWTRLSRAPTWLFVAIAGVLVLTQFAAYRATPSKAVMAPALPRFADTIPATFGVWNQVAATIVQTRTENQDEGVEPGADTLPYDDAIERTYQNANGERVMLALAIVRGQQQELKIHRQELCYGGQGFDILSRRDIPLNMSDSGGPSIAGHQFLAQSTERMEAATYWIRVGDIYSINAVETRLYLMKEGVQGRMPDGVLVRASQVIGRSDELGHSYQLQQDFLRDLLAALPLAARQLLVH